METKENYTRDEVLKIINLVGRKEIINLYPNEEDKQLLETIGYKTLYTENGFGGYSVTRYYGTKL